MNKKILLIYLLIWLLSLSYVSALDIKLEDYYPMPVEAGDYFDIKLRVINKESSASSDVSVKLIPEYPFSLDPGEESEITITGLEPSVSRLIKFRIRTDAGAKEGDNFPKFLYKGCAGCEWLEAPRKFSIIIVGAQTSFDIALQEIGSGKVFIAVANIGKNTANGINIKIPEQEYFETKLISSSIVGNLDTGDYTIVGFEITPKLHEDIEGEERLLVQIDYTDPLGERRTISKAIPLKSSLLNQMISEDFDSEKKQEKGFLSNVWFWISVILFVFIIIKSIFRKYKGKRKRRI